MPIIAVDHCPGTPSIEEGGSGDRTSFSLEPLFAMLKIGLHVAITMTLALLSELPVERLDSLELNISSSLRSILDPVPKAGGFI